MTENKMRVVFSSFFLTHHQLPFCLEMVENKNVEFVFIANEAVPASRLEFGYADMNDQYAFVLKAYASEQNRKKAKELIKEADVFLAGFSDKELKIRKRDKGFSFWMTERLFRDFGKGGFSSSKLRFFLMALKHVFPYRNRSDISYLANSAFLLDDLVKFFKIKNSVYRWGYFPETFRYSDVNFLRRNNKKIKILWVGRMISWKRPQDILEAAKKVSANNFEIELIGSGPLFKTIDNQINGDDTLRKCVTLKNSISYKQVREKMLESDIFVLSSDHNEGWGAVLNEAMNSGCCCVASRECGATNYLIKDKENGFKYPSGDILGLAKLLDKLLSNPAIRRKAGAEAYKTISQMWNAHVAATRLLELCDGHIPYPEGPCSLQKVEK